MIFHNQRPAGGFPPDRSGPLSRAEQIVWLAESRRQGGDLAGALAGCDRALTLDPELGYAYAVRGLVRRQQNDFAACIADCTEAVRRGFDHPEAYWTRAVAYDLLGQPEPALADCTRAIELDPNHANALNSRALLRGRLGEWEGALADCAEAIRVAPEWPLPYFHRAQVHHGRGDLDAALGDYDQTIRLLQKTPPSRAGAEGGLTLAVAHCRRGEARFDQLRDEEAEADFAEARRRDPGGAAEYLGGMWLRRSKFDRALEAFGQLVGLRPHDARARVGRGMAHEALGDFGQAVADYSEAIRLEGGGAGAYALRGRAHQRQGRTDNALADFGRHLHLHPDDTMAYLARSTLHKQRGQWPEVLADLTAAHAAAPEHPLVGNSLAWYLATCPEDALRDGRRAVELARRACRATGWTNPQCLDTLAAACAETGAFDEAVRWQTEALAASPEEEKAAVRARLEIYQDHQPYREGE
jgi:tetratricopeptide (TPR) repeat protein